MSGGLGDPRRSPGSILESIGKISRAVPAEEVEFGKTARYNSHPSGVECIEIVRWMSFDCGNAFKYVFRHEYKDGVRDLIKARTYLEDAVRHAVPVFLPGGYLRCREALNLVVDAECDPQRWVFFSEMRAGATDRALEAAKDIIDPT